MRERKRAPDKPPDVHFRLSVTDHQHLKMAAKARDRSVAYLLNQIVRSWIAEQHKQHREENANA